jgi:hypothetical protein
LPICKNMRQSIYCGKDIELLSGSHFGVTPKGFISNQPDGAGAPTAFRTAPHALVHLTCCDWCPVGSFHRGAHLLIGQGVARANDHRNDPCEVILRTLAGL